MNIPNRLHSELGSVPLPQASQDDSTRKVDENGVYEIAEFFGHAGTKLFGVTHLPMRDISGALVVCSPLYAEAIRNYRREVELARRLATLGVAVQRFHYRGSGNSDGVSTDISFESLRTDALAAVERLTQHTQVSGVAFLGTRLGALVAASVAAEFTEAPLVLWDPVIAGARYFREVFRYRILHELRSGIEAPRGGRSLEESLKTSGSVDIFAYRISEGLLASTAGRGLASELGGGPRPVLFLQLGTPLRRECADVIDSWKRSGFEVDVEFVDGEEPWWFGARFDNMRQMNERAGAVVGPSVTWILQQFGETRHEAW